ncbi:sodium-coupled neutral amino acid transporter 3-like [Brienomyrus brachyistius]|uniref:sodium-coupled neutral amino acid transporter 3-like n=1 Tax=Brienomyrus brachyistius TaxID=42636 RepID=UPI0020B456B6|nr:sodium-coupled neutral amino acid transporter 3-like [Brienomyrus brachyistius]XP_048877807.1 sodium-coupled neutral amino acid transporter 3-like [Brienomyrus brachyistius]XP_048877808.1 sodium-coupled neutral amino acid transporter 3-like [Brienomyrus brachyistius]
MELEKLSNGIHHPEHVTIEPRCTDEDVIVLARCDGIKASPEEREEFLPQKPDEQNQFTDFVGKTSLGMSIFNLSNAIMGSGILGLAYAMANTGIILFVILLTSIAALSAYSIHLLLRSAGIVGIPAYEQLGKRAFGARGKVLAACVITIHNIGAMSSYLFIVKSELPLVIQDFMGTPSNSAEWYLKGKYLVIIASLIIILPLALMRQLGYLGYTSGLSLTCMVFFLISVIYKKFNVRCPFEDYNLTQPLTDMVNSTSEDNVCEAKLITFNSRTSYAIPIVAFAFVCHPEVLPIYTELRKPTQKRMQRVANISVLAMFVMYLLTAVFGYLTFYDNVQSELLHTYKGDIADNLIVCVRLAVLMAVTLTVPVVIFPIRRALLQLFFNDKPFSWVRHIAITIVLLVFVNILVILVPNIKDIFGVIGATSAPTLIFILPGIFYIRIVPENLEPLNSRPKIQAACFAAAGFLLMVVSIFLIIMDWASGGNQSIGGH